MIQIDVKGVIFQHIQSENWKLRVTIEADGFVQMSRPFAGRVGDIEIQGLMPLLDNKGLEGVLDKIPSVGDPVSVGYADMPLLETDFTFQTPPNS